MPATLEHIEEASEVGIGIGIRIDQRMTHAGLRGEVHDGRKAMRGKQFRHGLAIANIHLREFEIGERFELRDAGLLQTRIVVGVEVVDAHHVVPVRQQAPRNMHADESGRSGDENGLLQPGSFLVLKHIGMTKSFGFVLPKLIPEVVLTRLGRVLINAQISNPRKWP